MYVYVYQLSWFKLIKSTSSKFYIVLGTLAADTQILLTSALYFKGRWLKSFDKHATRARCFRVPQRGCQDVPMMENTSRYRYAYIASLDADVVEIPYSVRYDPYIIDKLIKKPWCFYVKENSRKIIIQWILIDSKCFRFLKVHLHFYTNLLLYIVERKLIFIWISRLYFAWTYSIWVIINKSYIVRET